MTSNKVLIVSPVATHPPYGGNRQRILQIAGLFRANGYEIHLAVGRNREISHDAISFWTTIHRLEKSPHWRPTRKVVPLDSWYHKGLGEEIARLVQHNDIEIVLLNYIFHSRLLDFLPDEVVKLIDTHDVFSDRNKIYHGLNYAGRFFSCSASDEALSLRRADIAIAITHSDAEYFRSIAPTLRVEAIPLKLQLKKAVTAQEEVSDKTKTGKLGMVLSGNDLNLASLYQFVVAVDQHYGEKPPFTILVAGNIFRRRILPFPHRIARLLRTWITFVGEVPDIYRFYQELDVAIVPVAVGSGMAAKFAEAIAAGVPVLSTKAGSRGHNTTNELHEFETISKLVQSLSALGPESMENLLQDQEEYVAESSAQEMRGWLELMMACSSREEQRSHKKGKRFDG